MQKSKFSKFTATLAVIILECMAIVGALPLVPHTSSRIVRSFSEGQWKAEFEEYISHYEPFWEDNIIVLAAFLAMVLGGIIWYTRHESLRVQISAVLVVIGLLVLTIFTMQAFI